MKMKTTRTLRMIAAVLVLVAIAFVGVNVADYLRFNQALEWTLRLTPGELRAIGERSNSGFTATNIYSLGDIGISLIVDTWPENQRIYVSTNASGAIETKTLWYRDPELAKKLSPDNRLITIHYADKQWIVLPDKILVLWDLPPWPLRESMLSSVEITETDRVLLEKIIRDIPKVARGKCYNYEGKEIQERSLLIVRFTQDGRGDGEDIEACNAWVDTLGPLLDELSRLVPKEYPIEHKKLTVKWTPLVGQEERAIKI